MKRAVGVVLWLLLALLSYADDGTPYTPPATVMNLNCASPAAQIRTVTVNELYTQSGLYLEMVEIYFNETTTISGWRLYVNDHNTHKYIDIGSGLGDVRYPDGSTGTDTAAAYPKGTIIVYQIDGLDPSDGEVFIANTTAPLSEGAAVVVDYFNYYKNKQYNYYAVASSACSIIMSGVDPNLQDLSRLTDGSGDFYQTYPGTDEEVTPSPGGPNTDLLPPDSSLSAAVSIEALFDRTEAYSGDTVTLTLRIVNPSSGSIGVSDVNVSNLIPSGLSYVSHDGGTLLDPLMPSSPYGTVVSTSPQFFWRLVNGTFLLALPTGSSAEINLQLQVTAPAGTTITDTATLSVKQNNTGTASASDTLNVIAYVPPFGGRFDAWDTFRGIADRNISTKIAGKSFTLTVASLDATRTVAQDFNGTVCAAIVDSAGTPITDWAQLLFASTPTQNAVFTVARAVGGSDYAGVRLHWKRGVSLPCPLSSEDNTTLASDYFSVRPASFALSAPQGIAGSDFNLTFAANDFAAAPAAGYNESAGAGFGVSYAEHNLACTSGTLNPSPVSGWSFSDGVRMLTTRYAEAGVLDVNISDRSFPCTARFTRIDCDDANVSDGSAFSADLLPIGSAHAQVTFKPHRFDINATLGNFNGGEFTYLSNDLNMSAQLDANITAKNAEGNVTRNYRAGCYAKTAAGQFSYSTLPSALGRVFYYELYGGEEGNVTKPSPVTFALSPERFVQGSAVLKLGINFDRSRSVALNPFDFNLSTLGVEDTDGVEGSTLPSGTATFVYGRVRGYDLSTDQTDAPNPIEFEVYSALPTPYVAGMPQNVLGWYRNLRHTSLSQGAVLGGNDYPSTTKTGVSSTISIDASPLPLEGQHPIRIVNPDGVAHALIHLEIPSWLWYSTANDYSFADGTTCTRHPCFDYRFFGTSPIGGVTSGSFTGSDFPLTPAKKIIQKGEKVFR